MSLQISLSELEKSCVHPRAKTQKGKDTNMNKLLITGCLLATAFAAVAMPTKKELAAAQKLVEDVIAPDVKALNAGRKTVKDVADVQMKLAADAQSEAEKYLLLQSAFKLYSRGEEFDSAAKALTAITRDIKDVPPELITELVDKEFNRDIGLRAPKEIEAVVRKGERQMKAARKEQRQQILALWEDLKRVKATKTEIKDSSPVVHKAVESILKGMIKVPGRDYWLSATELTQEQWESIMEFNLSNHKGPNLPVECVNRDDCDVFLEKLNQTKEVQGSQFEFCLPTEGEWQYAARAGGAGNECWINPGVVGNVLDMAWRKENSSNQTHVVATRAANAFGFYDMLGNVWEWMSNRDGKGRTLRHGGSFNDNVGDWLVNRSIYTPQSRRYETVGLRLAAHKKVLHRPLFDEPKSIKMQEGKKAERLAQMDAAKKAVDNVKDAVITWMISKKRSMPPATLFALVKGDGDEKPVLDGGEKALVDLWGNGYMWQVKSNRFAIISSGPDGKFGTDDDIRSEKDWNAKKDAARQAEDELKRARKEIEVAGRDAERFAQVKAEKPQREVMRTDLYCVIDISGGPNAEHYPVSYLDAVPDGGWTDEYKTTKIVLRRIDAGTWPMMGNRRVTFTKPFYIGIFELTQKQIKLVSGNGSKKFVFENDMRPADNLTFGEMRGKNEEFDYPKTKEVAAESIIGRLRTKTGFAQIDLPTSYQFGCAWNAGTDGAGRDARLTGRHFHNQRDGKGGFSSAHTVVGAYQPNEWGIYDLHGNVWEMCLDYAGKQSQEEEVDPEGPEKGEKRLCRGGGWHSSDRFISADYIPQNTEADESHGWSGCRIVINAMPDEIKAKSRVGMTEMTPVEREFKIGAAPGTVVEVDIGGCPLQFVSCPAGKFRMGYSEKPEVAACREIEITSPFWMTKGRLTMEQLRALGVQEGATENKEGFACVNEATLMVEKLPQLLNKRFEGRVPEGYVFRLPTEAEFEYVQKAGAVGNDPRLAWGYSDDNDSVPNPWGVQKLFYVGRKDCFLDRVGGGKDVVSRFARNRHWTDLVSINYENQPSRDPVGWCEGNRWAVLRRERNRKLTGRGLYGSTFYFVLAPDESRLNKFIWK